VLALARAIDMAFASGVDPLPGASDRRIRFMQILHEIRSVGYSADSDVLSFNGQGDRQGSVALSFIRNRTWSKVGTYKSAMDAFRTHAELAWWPKSGYYIPKDFTSCTAGQFVHNAENHSISCSSCVAGHFSNGAQETECQRCVPGTATKQARLLC
jgi:hypothetical protein